MKILVVNEHHHCGLFCVVVLLQNLVRLPPVVSRVLSLEHFGPDLLVVASIDERKQFLVVGTSEKRCASS